MTRYEGVLIGGPRAGMRVSHEIHTYHVAVIPPVSAVYADHDSIPDEVEDRKFTYQHVKMRIDGDIVGMWKPRDWSDREAIEELFKGYTAFHALDKQK